MLRLSTDAVYFLQNFTPSEDRHSEDLNASKAAASLILWAVSYDVGFLSRQLNDNSFEVRTVKLLTPSLIPHHMSIRKKMS